MTEFGEGFWAGIVTMVAVDIALLLAIGGYLVVRDTIRRNGRWGINFEPVHCPICGELAPTVRMPKNWRQGLWGGHTCVQCGAEMDKWGNLMPQETLSVE